jgi:hypothetical protein
MTAGHLGTIGLIGNGLLLAIAVIKARQVLLDFLEFRSVPSGWRILFTWWLVLVASAGWITAAIPVLRA